METESLQFVMDFHHSRRQSFRITNAIKIMLDILHHVLQLRIELQVENLMNFDEKIKRFNCVELSGNLEIQRTQNI